MSQSDGIICDVLEPTAGGATTTTRLSAVHLSNNHILVLDREIDLLIRVFVPKEASNFRFLYIFKNL